MTDRGPAIPRRRTGWSLRAKVTAATTALAIVAAGPAQAADGGDEPAQPPAIAYARNVGDTIWMIGTEGGNPIQLTTYRSGDPVWSPDGTRIAYTRYQGPTYDGVWVMNPEGGDQHRLTTGFSGDPDWSPNGVDIAFANPRGIGMVNANTGESQHLIVNSDRDPAWSPDGTRIMFSRFQRGVWVMNADGSNPKQVAIEARHPAWSPGSVRIAYVNHHFEGIHVMGANGVYKRRLTADGGVFPKWSPSGTHIAYTKRVPDGIWLIGSDGASPKQIAALGWGPSWSPDNSKIAFTRQDGIWIMDANGGHPRRITEHGKDPVWSPDGTRLLYSSNHLDGIYATDTDGANTRQLVVEGFNPVWSPDGRRLAFTRRDGIWVIDANGSNPVRLTPEYTEGQVWSPEGTHIAYTSRFGGIYLVASNGGDPRQITEGGTDPVWSPQGTHIAYVTTGERSQWSSGPDQGINVIDTAGELHWQFTPDGVDPAWSPDSDRLAYATNSGEIRIGRLGNVRHQSTGHYGSDPTWSPDGKTLVYVGNSGGIYTMNAAGVNHRTVTLHRGLHPRWSPEGLQLIYQTTAGLRVLNRDGSHPLHLSDSGETPSWRTDPRWAPTEDPLLQAPLACPTHRQWDAPRFLPLWVHLASSSEETVSAPFEVAINFARPVIGFSDQDVWVANGRVTDFVSCGGLFLVRISPQSTGAVVVRVPPSAALDITGQGNLASRPLVRLGVGEDWKGAGGLNTWDRVAVQEAFTKEFGRTTPEIGFAASAQGCTPGSPGDSFRDSVIRRINWYRQMARLAEVVERVQYSEWAQRAALMMSAEGTLSHSPGSGWACHTHLGAEAAARSNLLLGAVGTEAVDGYMRNPGVDNLAVNHRRILLHPNLTEIGTGDIPGGDSRPPANALYIPEGHHQDAVAEIRTPRRFVAWPPPGYVPEETVWRRWSFSVPGADFSLASVTVAGSRGPVPVEILFRDTAHPHSPSLSDPAIVWALPGDGDSSPLPLIGNTDHCFRVTIEGVRIAGKTQTSYEYATCIFATENVPAIGGSRRNF